MKRTSRVLFFTIILLLAVRPLVLFQYSGPDHAPYRDPFSFVIVRPAKHKPVPVVYAGRLIIAEENLREISAPIPLIYKDVNDSFLLISLSTVLSLAILGLQRFLFKRARFRSPFAALSVWRI